MKAARVALSLLMLAVVAACAVADWSGSPRGEVVDRGKRWVEVRQDDGRTVTHETSKKVSRHCQVGERWPACA